MQPLYKLVNALWTIQNVSYSLDGNIHLDKHHDLKLKAMIGTHSDTRFSGPLNSLLTTSFMNDGLCFSYIAGYEKNHNIFGHSYVQCLFES